MPPSSLAVKGGPYDTQTLQTALALAAIGIPTFPCKAKDKRPATPNGFKDATTDEAQLRQWFAAGDLNLAMPTGAASGLVVLDFDLDAATDKNGEASFRDLYSDKPPLPPTLTVRTPRGGRHLFFIAPTEAAFPNSTSKLAPAVDTRGEGGYVLIPPSETAAGAYVQTDPTAPAELPAWILALLAPPRAAPIITPAIMPKATPEDVQKALAAIPATTNYGQWTRVGMALHAWNSGADGLAAWDAWSSTGGDKYHPGECARKWRTFDSTRGVTAAALFGIAKDFGFDQHREAIIGQFLPVVPAALAIPLASADASPRGTAAGGLPRSVDAGAWVEVEYPPIEQILQDAVDMGAKVILVAPSKMRKSFFMMQAGLAIAAGLRKFLGWTIPTARPALLINFEIDQVHYQRRLKAMMKAMGITPAMLGGRLRVINARGYKPTPATMQELAAEVSANGTALILVDPIYKLMPGDESKQEEVKALLSGLDSVCVATGAALWYAHHAGKGEAGDRLAVDRASGSGVWARDFDCQISLVAHVEDGLTVCEQIARGYKPRDPESIKWNDEGYFEQDATPPKVRTTFNRRKAGPTGKQLGPEDALAALLAGPLPATVYRERLAAIGFAEKAARAIVDELIIEGQIKTFNHRKDHCKIYYGLPEAIAILAAKIKAEEAEAAA